MPHPNHPGILRLPWRSSGGNRHGLAGFGHLLLFFDGLRAVVQTFTVAVQPVEQTHFWNEGDHIGCRNEKESKLAVGRTELQHKAGRNRCNDLRDQIDIGHGRIDARQVGRSRAFEDAWHPILLHADRSQVRPQSFDASGNNHDNKQHHLVEPFRVPLAYSERPVMCSLAGSAGAHAEKTTWSRANRSDTSRPLACLGREGLIRTMVDLTGKEVPSSSSSRKRPLPPHIFSSPASSLLTDQTPPSLWLV
eukprot:scaffold489_cov259-Pinguiococcus_pyrenoidosus.AAC.28